MSIKYAFALLVALLIMQPVFADDDMGDKPCMPIVKSCLKAGYSHRGEKQFWKGCMKPLIMGQTVKGVTVDPKDVTACRAAKIDSMEKELNEFKSVQQ